MREVREACAILKLSFRSDRHFEIGFTMLDEDESGALDFLEFMEFLRMVRDKDGPFKIPRLTGIANLAAMDKMDLFLLMETLGEGPEHEDEDKEESSSSGTSNVAGTRTSARTTMRMSQHDLLKKATSALEVDPAVDLGSAFGVTTLEDLFEHAKWKRDSAKGVPASNPSIPDMSEHLPS